jgi:hypothetical protein
MFRIFQFKLYLYLVKKLVTQSNQLGNPQQHRRLRRRIFWEIKVKLATLPWSAIASLDIGVLHTWSTIDFTFWIPIQGRVEVRRPWINDWRQNHLSWEKLTKKRRLFFTFKSHRPLYLNRTGITTLPCNNIPSTRRSQFA